MASSDNAAKPPRAATLDAELSLIRPEVTVALGATAAKALTGRSVTVGDLRGTWVDWEGPGRLTVTVHPSSILRTDGPQRSAAREGLARDLAAVRDALASLG